MFILQKLDALHLDGKIFSILLNLQNSKFRIMSTQKTLYIFLNDKVGQQKTSYLVLWFVLFKAEQFGFHF